MVDSPGIGESDIMDKMVEEYLPEAFAFIYVINSADAGGIQKDRVGYVKYCLKTLVCVHDRTILVFIGHNASAQARSCLTKIPQARLTKPG